MPIPSYTEELGINLAPGIDIINEGDIFGGGDEGGHVAAIKKELTERGNLDGIEFLPHESEKDISLEAFLASQREKSAVH